MWSPPREGSVRITGGQPAGVGQFPYQALIVSDDVEMWGGSLITRKAVLTSSGCTIGRQKFVVRLGGIHRTETESTAWIVESSWALTHPDFSMFAYYSHSVAVVYLPEEAPLNSFIGLVALRSPLEVNDTFVGENAIIAGWGWPSQTGDASETLQWTDVTVVPNKVCEQFYESGAVIESTLCAGNEYTGSCWGDLGSPLVVKTGGGYKQIGVSSFLPEGEGCDVAGAAAAYVRITSVLDWITSNAISV
ncbi:venom protease-like [Schistocerca serialis cubense]|uniref:venom protease-like n=1 Tax=Schistocerca serialis cubense TaxID=2023355 RepID=UPI00214F48BC|nr:venom protease-like [Schistocerca serialis cubense]